MPKSYLGAAAYFPITLKQCQLEREGHGLMTGVPIRLELAKAAMQGLLANKGFVVAAIGEGKTSGVAHSQVIAECALGMADALLAAYEEEE